MTGQRVLYLIARIGGWDGISVQSKLWIKLLLSMGKKVTVATGEIEDKAGTMDVRPFSMTRQAVISEMSLGSQAWLFRNSFREKYKRMEWVRRFVESKDIIKEKLGELCGESDVVIAHNFSIKHLVPAAWAAVHELASENPRKRFVSIDADSPFERGFVISDVHPEVLWMIGNPSLWAGRDLAGIDRALTKLRGKMPDALPGPVPLPNIFHVSFNSYQSRVIREVYGVNPENMNMIPDMGEFASPRPWRMIPRSSVLRLISSCQAVNPRKDVTAEDVFFISPVRPVYRKNLKNIAHLASRFGAYLREMGEERNVFLVVTHPTDKAADDESYWRELKDEVGPMDLTLVHLGDRLLLRRKKGRKGILYPEFMWAASRLNSISVVGSSMGAWENGIVESTEARLPVSVNPLLPAYQDMVMMGLRYIPCPITRASMIADKGLEKEAWMRDPSIMRFFEAVRSVIFDKERRRLIVDSNFRVGRENLSIETAKPSIRKILG